MTDNDILQSIKFDISCAADPFIRDSVRNRYIKEFPQHKREIEEFCREWNNATHYEISANELRGGEGTA